MVFGHSPMLTTNALLLEFVVPSSKGKITLHSISRLDQGLFEDLDDDMYLLDDRCGRV